ncbi:hypothetical protein VNI00_015326 [Paramarasmius palmivorus]|uniref:NAD-dependent epimerase/dehydratase domain-containing protein n=1 Tax=Paramarasmius palmivorus TaxID=297713 RepID=A0AAW0BLS7_9AGAR
MSSENANSPNTSAPHLVTGGSGFIALHLVKQLLESGYTVHATVRSLKNEKKVAPLKTLQDAHPGRLHLFEADLLKPGSFGPAMKGCEVVHHVASPFLMAEKIKDGQRQCIEPALEGTRNVLQSVNETESVRRVVMTSTAEQVGAIFSDYIDVYEMENKTLHERYWNTKGSATDNPYHYSKVLAEQEAWRIASAQSHWTLVTILPGLVLGPSLSPDSESGSLYLIDELLRGELFFGVPDLSFTTVDVRDVATAHIRAAEVPGANGRYIVCEKEMTSFLDVAKVFKRVHKRPYVIPGHQIPTMVVRVLGPLFGLSQQWISRNVGVRFQVDNRRTSEELGLKYRSLQETLEEHYKSWCEMRSR